MKFRDRLAHWAIGAVGASIQGGATTAKAFMGAAGFSAAGQWVGVDIPVLQIKQLVAIFLFGMGWAFSDYLSKNPMPDPALQAKRVA